jgi:hypothetical protein
MRVADLIGLVKKKQVEIADSIVSGYCVNFETYQRLIGQYQGLDEALNIINLMLEEETKDVE